MASGTIAIAAALVLCITGAATAIGQGITASHAMDAIARQPEAAGDIRSSLVLSLALVRADLDDIGLFRTALSAQSVPLQAHRALYGRAPCAY